jgi:hypothetical protein
MLDTIPWGPWPEQTPPARRARRILLASSGLWYNLKPYCNGTGAGLFGIDSTHAPCEHYVLHHHVKPADIELDHDEPLRANPKQFWRHFHRYYGIPPWGWYSWGRRLQGTATIGEYASDLAALLDAAKEWERNVSATLVWLEATPQHFGNGSCQRTPATPMEPGPLA